MNTIYSRSLASVGIISLLGAIGLVSSRPAHSGGGPVPVTISNTSVPTNPTDVAAPSQAIQFLKQPDTYGTNSSEAEEDIQVPANKRLVIEYISAEVGTGYGSVTVETVSGGNLAAYYLIERTTSHTHQFFPTRIYADPGTPVRVIVDSVDGKRVYADVEISGYYGNVP